MILLSNDEDFLKLFPFDKRDGVVFFDTETTGLDVYNSKPLLFSLKTDSDVFVGDLTKISYFCKSKDFFEGNKVVMHNAPFDWKVMYHNYGISIKDMHCTLVSEQMIHAGIMGIGFGLDEVASRRLGKTLEKGVRQQFVGKESDDFTKEQFLYAMEDVLVLEPIYEYQLSDIARLGLQEVYRLECDLLHITAEMEYTGVELDVDRVLKAIPVVEKLVKDSERRLQDSFIKEGIADNILFFEDSYRVVKLSSPSQLLKAFNDVGIEVESTGSKVLSEWDSKNSKISSKMEELPDTEDTEFSEMDVGFSHPVLKARAIYITAAKFLNSYYRSLPKRVNPVTSRVHGSFHQYGARSTGRYSSDLQQIPNRYKLEKVNLGDYDIRSCFVAGEGKKFIIADYSGQEMGVLALFSQDKDLLEKMIEGDVHSFVARKLFNIPEDIWDKKKHPYNILRNVAKGFNFALIYGGGEHNFLKVFYNPMLNAGYKTDIVFWRDRIHFWKNELFPNVGKFMESNAKSAVHNLYTRSISGRRRNWDPSIREDKWKTLAAMREGMNMPIQATSADITKLAMILVRRNIEFSKAKIVMCVHDEIIVQAEENYVDVAKDIVKEQMEYAVTMWFPDAEDGIIVVEPAISDIYDK